MITHTHVLTHKYKWSASVLTLASTDGDTGKTFKDLLASSSDEQSEHRKWSNFLASSMVIPIQEGWNLQNNSTWDIIIIRWEWAKKLHFKLTPKVLFES